LERVLRLRSACIQQNRKEASHFYMVFTFFFVKVRSNSILPSRVQAYYVYSKLVQKKNTVEQIQQKAESMEHIFALLRQNELGDAGV